MGESAGGTRLNLLHAGVQSGSCVTLAAMVTTRRPDWRERARILYFERKAAGLCTRCGAPAVVDGQFCQAHRDAQLASNRASKDRVRSEFRAAGRCAAGCGVKCETYRCAGCAVKYDRLPSTGGVGGGVGASIDANHVTQWRQDSDGYERYRGQLHRGKPTTALLDAQDLAHAEEQLRRGKAGLIYAHSPEVQALPKSQRVAAIAEALGLLALGGRFLDEVLDRHKFKG